ncbi:MAG TPA: prenyltransferase/squalene oxidase repeat-containing protein [Verrucomicrobiales bacterium]|nr:prenyltransferase/squalene oxidase repeat-containing protein [Verrucomicrobiales bacterium]
MNRPTAQPPKSIPSLVDLAASVDRTLERTRKRLLAERNEAGYWEGELSSSALSTATAVIALATVDADAHAGLIAKGLSWLERHVNPGGGWGDTIVSFSNISTTLLCRAALAMGRPADDPLATAADAWFSQRAGSMRPEDIRRAVVARYGKDRTFSVPILMACAIGGLLGPNRRAAWNNVLPLPFELAVLPRSWFGALRLPVVSYALPALIAIGYARFHHAPPALPWRKVRQAAWPNASALLDRIQPENGGFLEATPLTSFVAMALASSGQGHHPVVERALRFLKASVRPDGSWPIDTNLATWVTTLSIKNLDDPLPFDAEERERVLEWLLRRQHSTVHSYTRAEPGGWAWTDLPGGVPDSDDTAGALLALRRLGGPGTPHSAKIRPAAAAGVAWLLGLQNRDGGVPTFCRGWGTLPFDRSSPDITAHALRAWIVWREDLPEPLRQRVEKALRRAARYLNRTQSADGSWKPLWFGNQHRHDEANPVYGTAQVTLALLDLGATALEDHRLESALQQGLDYLQRVQNPDGGWGSGEEGPSSVEESALALAALARAEDRTSSSPPSHVLTRGAAYLTGATQEGATFPAAPVGFYFAKLWYFEKLYPLVWTMGALAALKVTARWSRPASANGSASS